MIFVEQAIEAIRQQELNQAHLHAVPISLVGQYLGLIKGNKTIEPEDFNPFGKRLYTQEAKELIEPAAAATFLELSAAQLVPAWVISQVDVKQLRAASS